MGLHMVTLHSTKEIREAIRLIGPERVEEGRLLMRPDTIALKDLRPGRMMETTLLKIASSREHQNV